MNFLETLNRSRTKNNRTTVERNMSYTKRKDTFDQSFLNDEDDRPSENRLKVCVQRLNDRCTSTNALVLARSGQPSPILDRRPNV